MNIVDSSGDKGLSRDKYQVYSYRFIIGFVFSFAAIQNVLMWLVFGPLQTTLQDIYGVSVTVINLATILVSNISYLPANFVATYIIDTLGLRIGVICGTILTTAGLWTRFFCTHGFVFIFVGQLLGGLAQPFFYSTPQKISNTWFSPQERTLSTTVISISLNIGNALGAFIPQFFVNIYEPNNDKVVHQIQNMMLWVAIAGSFASALVILFFKEKPPTAPSKGATATKYSYFESLRSLIKDWNSVLFIVASSASSGAMFTYGSVIQQLVDPFGIDGNQTGNILTIGVICGFFGAGAVGYYVNKTKKFKISIITLCFVCTCILCGNYFGAKSGNAYILGVCYCLYNSLITPVMPISLETGVELSFPVAEATSGGIWFTLNQLFSTGESLVIDTIIGDYDAETSLLISYGIMAGYQLVTMLLLLFVKENLKRRKYENESLLRSEERRKLLGESVMSSIGGAVVKFGEEF